MRTLTQRQKAFAREVGVIVLGVLIALAFGEVADAWRWRSRAAVSNQAVNIELARAAGVLEERALVQPCLDRRLAELDRIVRAARVTKILPNIGVIGFPPNRPLQTAAWDDAVSSGTLPHLTARRRSELSLIYPLLRDYPKQTLDESAEWATLRVLESAPGSIADDLLTQAGVTIARLRWGSASQGLNADQIQQSITGLGVRPSYFILFDREVRRAALTASVRDRAICRPLAIGLS